MRLIPQSSKSSIFSLDFTIAKSTFMWVRLNKDKTILSIILLKFPS